MNKLIIILSVILMYACAMKKESTINQNKKPNTENPLIKTGEIISKNYVNKKGEVGDGFELYFRASVQDYFIKFCESSITADDLKPFINKVIRVEGEIISGDFDTCPNQAIDAESRSGNYLIIHKLLN